MINGLELKELVKHSILYRKPLDISKPCQVYVTGVPIKINFVCQKLESQGFIIKGVILFEKNSEIFKYPTISSKDIEEDIPIVFAGRPSKRWFDGISRKLSTCLWYDLPGKNHLQMGYDPDFLDNNFDFLLDLFNSLGDKESQTTLVSCIKSRISGNAGYYYIADYPEYSHPHMVLKNDSCILDIGAYDGASSISFQKKLNKNGLVIGVEASLINFQKFFINTNNYNNIIPIWGAAWNENSILKFNDSQQGSSCITNDSDILVPSFSLDNLIPNFNRDISLIKMDIEGAEKEALYGCKELIHKFRPYLIISAYHKPTDLWTLKKIIENISSDSYKFLLGHHNYYYTETDLYCFPQ